MTDKRWKRCERALAERLGGKRVPITGRQRGDTPDVSHPWLAIESKSRGVVPAWLKEAVEQAVAATWNGQLPIAIIHEVGQRHGQDLVVMRLLDFEDWFVGSTGREKDDPQAEYAGRG